MALVTLRIVATAILILFGGAVAALFLCVLALRLVFSTVFTLSGIRRRAAGGQVLSW